MANLRRWFAIGFFIAGIAFSPVLVGQNVANRNVVISNSVASPANVNCVSGCAGGTPVTAADSLANPTVPTNLSYGLLFNPATSLWDRARGDSTNGQWVNLKTSVVVHTICDSGCGSSATVLMADTTANPTIPQSASFGMLYNSATWDRWRGDATSGAWVNIKNATVNTSDAHTTAAVPLAAELSDGAAFYTGTKTGQLPTALDGSGYLKVHEQGTATVTGTVTTTPPSNASTNVAQFGGSNVVTGTGVGGAGIPRVTVSSDSTVTANAGTNLNTSALAIETGGNLATVNTNTAPLVVAGAGGYVRQDSTATIAKETGGNLATIVTNTTSIAKDATLTNGTQKTQLVNSTTANITTIASSQLDTQLLASSATRKAWTICNYSSDVLLLKFGSGASQWNYTLRVQPQACYEQTHIAYTGQIDAVWYPGYGGGQAVITELQP